MHIPDFGSHHVVFFLREAHHIPVMQFSCGRIRDPYMIDKCPVRRAQILQCYHGTATFQSGMVSADGGRCYAILIFTLVPSDPAVSLRHIQRCTDPGFHRNQLTDGIPKNARSRNQRGTVRISIPLFITRRSCPASINRHRSLISFCRKFRIVSVPQDQSAEQK